MIAAGFGLNALITKLQEDVLFKGNKILNGIQAGILLLFIIFSFRYTQREEWKELLLDHFALKKILRPAAPANRYLHPDDVRIFKNIKNKIFMSLPWKGTVIGIATDNYPTDTKSGTISITSGHFQQFINSKGCETKNVVVDENKIDYVYLPPFNCRGFQAIDKSTEGLYLYKVL